MEIIFLIILAIVVGVIAFIIGKYFGSRIKSKELEFQRKDAISKSRAILGGQFSENLAPYLPNFPYNPNECRFVGKPIDFIVFKGLDNKQIEEVIFVEVKSGNSKLNENEKKLKEAIENKKVSFEEYKIPKDITRIATEKEYFD